MNIPTRDFTVEPSSHGQVPLLIGLMGGPGAGKTYSALTLAKGMRMAGQDKPCLIDTEAGRSQKYRDAFDFNWINFQPPFRPSAFLAAANAALASNPCAIVFDSMSDEHEGIGGVLDWHDEELNRMAGDDWAKRERMTQAAWIKPKAERRMMINGLLQIRTPMIFTFRAREKTKPLKNDRGKMEPVNVGWQPIAPSEIVHNMDINCLLPLRSDGVPVWKSDKLGEDFVIKLPVQFRSMFRDGMPITADIGRALAEWARGGAVAAVPAVELADLIATGDARAEAGMEALQDFWKGLTTRERKELGPARIAAWKAAASAPKETSDAA